MDRDCLRIAMVVDNLRLQGITTVVLNLCTVLARNGIRTDILCGGARDLSIERSMPYGSHIIMLPDRKVKTLAYLKALRQCVAKGNYDCVHFHCNSATVFVDMLPLLNTHHKIALHCHNVTCSHPVFHMAFRSLVAKSCDYRFACSSEAGKWMYGNKPFSVMPNCFDTHAFKFSAEKRAIARANLGIDPDTFVYGHVGVFNKQKNQIALLEIFKGLVRTNNKAILLLVGDGPLRASFCSSIPSSLADRIMVINPTNKINELYCAMDCFLFPSLFESLGLAVVEAQLSGLPCFVSNEVPDEASVSNAFYKLPRGASSQTWINEIENCRLIQCCHPGLMERLRSDIDFERYSLERLKILSQTMYTICESAFGENSINMSEGEGEQDA